MKKQFLIIAGCAVSIAALAACSATSKEEASMKPVVQTEEVMVAEDQATIHSDAVASEITEEITPESDWSVVLETQITHESNIEGFLNDQFGVTVGYSGQIYYTNDGAKTWTQAQNESWCRFCLAILNENLIWCGGNGNQVRVSKDGAAVWEPVSDVNLSAIHSNIDFVDDMTGWVSSNVKAASTTDGGVTWKELVLPEEVKSIAALSVRTAMEGCFMTHTGQLYFTTDGGETWTQKDTDLATIGVKDEKGEIGLFKYNTTSADMNFTDENHGTIVFAGSVPGEGFKVWCLETEDGGDTFTTEEVPLPEGFKANKVYLSKDGIYLTVGSLVKEVVVMQRK